MFILNVFIFFSIQKALLNAESFQIIWKNKGLHLNPGPK